jgi:SAM-dependent methyltransferase
MANDNAQQIEFWNGPVGEKWARLQRFIEPLLKPFADAAMARLAPQPGERVLDIGCGAGDTALMLADRVLGHGFVLGIDVSRALLQRATARAAAIPEYPIRFLEADAATHRFEPASFDALHSRFGVMFFADPAAAFANLARALKPGGRLAFICWRDRRENEWVRVPARIAHKHTDLPPAPPPTEPGPFAFAEKERIEAILGGAGFADIRVEPLDLALAWGADPRTATQVLMEMGPVGSVMIDKPEPVRAAVIADLEQALAPFASRAGVRLGTATWLVSALRPPGA